VLQYSRLRGVLRVHLKHETIASGAVQARNFHHASPRLRADKLRANK
jgi:hypothetical protein